MPTHRQADDHESRSDDRELENLLRRTARLFQVRENPKASDTSEKARRPSPGK